MIPSVVILAGGLAKRLYPVTKIVSKSMVTVAGKPFISHQLKLLKKNGVERVVICAGYLYEQIREFVKDGSEFGLKIDFSIDGDKLLGTGGAIRKGLDLLDDIFMVLYGDSYLNVGFKPIVDYFLANNKRGLMTVFKNNGKWDKSNIIYRNGIIIKYDKESLTKDMKYIDYGLSILKKEVFTGLDCGLSFDLSEVYKTLIETNEMLGYEVKERFFEIGSPEGLRDTVNYFEKLSAKNRRIVGDKHG